MAKYHPTRRSLWFGTRDHMEWFVTPTSGADSSPGAWGASGTLLNGLGYGQNSFLSHKTYNYSWPKSSSRQDAQRMMDYFSGSYGRGLIYFLDPLTFTTNILPAYLASPGLALDDSSTLVKGVTPGSYNFPPDNLDSPLVGAAYQLGFVPAGWRGYQDATFIPIPKGMTLAFGADYWVEGTGAGVYLREENQDGSLGTIHRVERSPNKLWTKLITGVKGVWVYIGKDAGSTNTTIGLRFMSARLLFNGKDIHYSPPGGYGSGPYGQFPYPGVTPRAETNILGGNWVGGQGHSGCRFTGPPTYVSHTGVNGGQIEFAASFIEVGSSVYG